MPDETPSVVEVREAVRKFLGVLDANEPGCFTWWEFLVASGTEVRDMLNKVLPPKTTD